MYPTLLNIPSLGITLTSHNACLLLAVIACCAIGPRWVAALDDLDPQRVFRAMLLLILCASAGGPMYYRVRSMALCHRGMRISEGVP